MLTQRTILDTDFTDLVVDGLSGWRRSQRLVDPCSGVESHGLRRFALGPKTLRKHPLLIIKILQDKHKLNIAHIPCTRNPDVRFWLLFKEANLQLSPLLALRFSSHINVHTVRCDTTEAYLLHRCKTCSNSFGETYSVNELEMPRNNYTLFLWFPFYRPHPKLFSHTTAICYPDCAQEQALERCNAVPQVRLHYC